MKPDKTERDEAKAGALAMEENRRRITQGRYVAEILQGRNTTKMETFWYYVLHRDGSPEIIDLKKYNTYGDAVEGATKVLARMNRAASAAE